VWTPERVTITILSLGDLRSSRVWRRNFKTSGHTGPGHMLQYVRSEIPIFGQFRTHVFGQISYTLGSDLGPSSRLRTHADELGREVDCQSTLKVPLPCLAHIYIVISVAWSPRTFSYAYGSDIATDQRSRLFLDRTSPRFSSFRTQFWIGHTAKFGVKSVRIGIGHTAAYSRGLVTHAIFLLSHSCTVSTCFSDKN